jgi:Mn-containing catalase
MSSSANARGPWNEGQGPWGRGEGWEYIDDPLRQVVETQGQLRKAVAGTSQTADQAQQMARTLGQKRSQEVKAAVPTGPNQWSSYPQSSLASPKVAQDGQ